MRFVYDKDNKDWNGPVPPPPLFYIKKKLALLRPRATTSVDPSSPLGSLLVSAVREGVVCEGLKALLHGPAMGSASAACFGTFYEIGLTLPVIETRLDRSLGRQVTCGGWVLKNIPVLSFHFREEN